MQKVKGIGVVLLPLVLLLVLAACGKDESATKTIQVTMPHSIHLGLSQAKVQSQLGKAVQHVEDGDPNPEYIYQNGRYYIQYIHDHASFIVDRGTIQNNVQAKGLDCSVYVMPNSANKKTRIDDSSFEKTTIYYNQEIANDFPDSTERGIYSIKQDYTKTGLVSCIMVLGS